MGPTFIRVSRRALEGGAGSRPRPASEPLNRASAIRVAFRPELVPRATVLSVRLRLYHVIQIAWSDWAMPGGGSATSQKLYSSKVIKAGALLGDTMLLLSAWDTTKSVEDNLSRIRGQNVLGKASRSRVEDILPVLKQRYLREPQAVVALSTLVRAGTSREILSPILYFYTCRSDRLLHDAVTELLEPKWLTGQRDIDTPEMERVLGRWVEEGLMAGRWSSWTIRLTARGLLSTLRDFGILEGPARTRTKRIRRPYLPPPAFAYIALVLSQNGAVGRALVESPEWRLFFLHGQQVERLFVEAHQQGLLHYQAAGSVCRIDFVTETLEEYANVVAARAN